jgi:uncharacterized protein
VISVARISFTPVKNFRLGHPGEVMLGRDGVPTNRRFLLVGPDGQRLRSSATPWPVVVSAEYDAAADALTLRFPEEGEVSGSAAGSEEEIELVVGQRPQTVRIVPGPWEAPLSRLAGFPVRLARLAYDGAGMVEPVSIVSSASVARLAREAGLDSVDARRFRMLFELDGCGEHEEDTWAGRLLRAGEAVLEVGDPIIRCAVTTRDPDTGERDLDALRVIERYRGRSEDGAIYFGRYAHVVEPGRVRVGDAVELL